MAQTPLEIKAIGARSPSFCPVLGQKYTTKQQNELASQLFMSITEAAELEAPTHGLGSRAQGSALMQHHGVDEVQKEIEQLNASD